MITFYAKDIDNLSKYEKYASNSCELAHVVLYRMAFSCSSPTV